MNKEELEYNKFEMLKEEYFKIDDSVYKNFEFFNKDEININEINFGDFIKDLDENIKEENEINKNIINLNNNENILSNSENSLNDNINNNDIFNDKNNINNINNTENNIKENIKLIRIVKKKK